jgi:hypothetical protein
MATPRSTPFRRLGLEVVILSCAASAGIHGALTPVHFDEGAGAGGGFLVATVLLAALAAAMLVRPESRTAVALAGAVLAGVIASYGLAVTSGVPVLHPEQEPVDGLAVATKLVEAAGLLAAASVLQHAGRSRPADIPRPKGTLA